MSSSSNGALSVLLLLSIETFVETKLSENCNKRPADVIFVLDSSSSIWEIDYGKQRSAVQNIATTFDIGPGPHQTKVGVITFSDRAHLEFSLGRHTDPRSLRRAISLIPYRTGSTNTAAAIRMMSAEFATAGRDIPRIGVVITDGRSRDAQETRSAARRARGAGTTMYAVGVGKGVDINELRAIASDPHRNVFQVASYSVLERIADTFKLRACEELPSSEEGGPDVRPSEKENVNTECYDDRKSDIVFAFNSYSLGRYKTDRIYQFLKRLISLYDLQQGRIRIGIASGYCKENQIIPLWKHTNVPFLLQDLGRIIIPTTLAGLLRRVRTETFQPVYGIPQRDRRRIVTMFVDGTESAARLALEAAESKRQGIQIYVVNIGKVHNFGRITQLCSAPWKRHLIQVPDYKDMTSYVNSCKAKLCA